VQIAYLILTRQKVVYLCEIKFTRSVIGLEIIKDMEDKISSLNLPKGYALCPVLLHTSSLSDQLLDRQFFFQTISVEEFFSS